MASRKVRLRRLAGGLKMRSRDRLIRLRETKLRQMGVGGYRSLMVLPLMLAMIVLVGWLRVPQTTYASFRPNEERVMFPLSGWVVRADSPQTDDRLDVPLVFAEVTWAELEKEEGVFSFDEFEEKNRLNEWWAGGKRLILRFVMDSPGVSGHMDIPGWLYEALGGEGPAGRFYQTPEGGGFAPDYSNVMLREAHRRVIAALAERYNGHPGVAYIEIGSMGWDGEWTVDLTQEEAEPLPVSSISREYAWHYTSAFSETLMLMRRPYKEAELMQVGLFNARLGDEEATWEYIDSIAYGGYDEQIETDLIAMGDFHLLSPSGAHIPDEIDLNALTDEEWSALSRQICESRLNYAVLDGGIDSLGDDAVARLREMEPMIGYRMWIRAAEWDSRLRAGIRSKVILNVRNDGVAPLHAAWPVALALFDGDRMLFSESTELDASMILPGEQEMTTWIDIPNDTQPGDYTLKLAVLDPSTGEPGVYLTMDECDPDTYWTALGELEVIG